MKKSEAIDHDRLFKELLTTFFAEFIELFLPDVSAYLDRDNLEFLDKEVFTDVTSGEKHEVDIIARAMFRGQPTFFVVHVENQAKPQERFNRRMFVYFARLHEKYDLPIYPIALFSYDRPLRAESSRYQVVFPNKRVLDFSFDVIQLNRLNWRDFVRQPNPVASALMAKMKIAPKDRPKVKLECLRLLATLRLNPAKMQLISGFVDTYLKLNAQEEQEFQKELETVLPSEKETVMEIVTSWMKEGMQKEALSLVLRLLQRQTGTLSEETEGRIRRLSTAQLEDLGIALLDFQSAADLKTWLHNHPPASA